MVQCLRKYEWGKLPRSRLPEGKGIMGAWAKLASRAQALYCGYLMKSCRECGRPDCTGPAGADGLLV